MTLPPSIAKYLSVFKKLRATRGHTEPVRDWLVLASAFILLIVVSVGWNILFFLGTITSETVAEEATAVETTETDAVERVNEAFAAREAEQARYRSEYRFIDPSR